MAGPCGCCLFWNELRRAVQRWVRRFRRIVASPTAAHLVVGIEGAFEAVVLAGLPGPFHHDGADLVGDLRSATGDEFVVYPADQDHIAVPAVFEPLA
jgi:hypothetical protein